MNTKNIKIYRQLLKKISAEKIRNADFIDANFRSVNFEDANLEDTNFKDTNFKGVDFRDTNFKNATFKYASFRNANFKYANFKDANLEGVNFEDTNFKNASLEGANFKNANLKFKGIKKFKYFPSLYKYPSFSFIFENKDSEIRLGCFQRTIKEWENNFWNNYREFPNNNSEKSNKRKMAFEINKKWILENE